MSTEQSTIAQPVAVPFDTQRMPVQMPREDSTGCDSSYSSVDVSMPPPTPIYMTPGPIYGGPLPLGGVGGNNPFSRQNHAQGQKPAQFVRFVEGGNDDTESATEAETESVTSADFRDPNCWETFAVPDIPGKNVTTVYEAWEVIATDDTERIFTWKSFMGIRFGTRWESMCDGYVELNGLMAFGQGELADKVKSAARDHEATQVRDGGKKSKSYEQDLADRAYKLPADIYNQLQRLINTKAYGTNKNPHRQRAWKLVLLQKEELPMTALVPERKKKGIFRRTREKAAVDRWFVVIKGEETKFSKEGWKRHDRYTNPWSNVDRREMLEDRVERGAQ